MNKDSLRKEIAVQKRSLSDAVKQSAAESVFALLQGQAQFINAECILCYWSLPDELSTYQFIKEWYQHKVILLPVVKGNVVELIQFTGEDNMQKGAYGILEPLGTFITDYKSIDLAIVPGVAFTPEGYRMGRGGGYYDRLLPQLPNAYKIGVGYKMQERKHIPTEPHDVKLHDIIFA